MIRVAKVGGTLLALVILWAAFNSLFVWFPQTDSPARADVVVVLGGNNIQARLDEGSALVEQGFAPLLYTDAFSYPAHLCQGPAHRTMCFEPTPFTTQGEARNVAQRAKARGWTTVLLVVSEDQATRARVRFRRCYHLGLRLVTVPSGNLEARLHATLYEDGALIKAETLQRGC